MSSCLQAAGWYQATSVAARPSRPTARIGLGREVAEPREQLVERERRLLSPALAHGERVVRLPVAVHDHERDLLELRVADPLAERLVALVDLDAEALADEPVAERCRRPRDAPRRPGSTRACTGESQNGNAPA